MEIKSNIAGENPVAKKADDQNGSSDVNRLQKEDDRMESNETEMLKETSPQIQRRLKRSDGVNVEGAIEGIKMTFTADTGATRSVISHGVFDRINPGNRPQLRKSVGLLSVSGAPLKEYGCANFNLRLGSLELQHELVVADIDDEALLGVDILLQGTDGPADILLSEGVIRLNGTSIPCFQVGRCETARKVTVVENVLIPPISEMLVDVFIERRESDDERQESAVLIEPNQNFKERYQLVMAASLADIKHNVSHKVRILNPFGQSCPIAKDAVVGIADEAVDLESIIQLDEMAAKEVCKKESLTPDAVKCQAETLGLVRRVKELKQEFPSHLKELYGKASEHLSGSEQKKVADMLIRHNNTFSKHEFDLGLTSLTEHAIDVGNHKPIKQPSRRVPVAFAAEEENILKQMEQQGIIRPSTSPWASTIVLVRKKSGKIRPCVDYRRLNAVTVKDAFPLPRVSDCLDAVAGATLFSCFDVTSGYHQIPVRGSDVPKTAFCTKYGLFEYTSMPMGLTNSPATFQRLMEIALRGLQWHTCLIYLDDIVVFGTNFEEHLNRVEEVLDRLQVAGLKLKPEKCQLFQLEVDFLGHVVSADGVRPNPHNIAKIEQWPVPTNVTGVRQILGMGNYYRRFVKNYSALVRPLTDLTRKGVEFKWSAACIEAFNALKLALVGSEIMAYPKESGLFILDTDASDSQIAGILSQMQDGRERVISYGSRVLGKAEKKLLHNGLRVARDTPLRRILSSVSTR